MVTNEEDVPRFSLRRGARFLETFRDQPQSEDGHEEWLTDLGHDLGEDVGQDPQPLAEGLAPTEADPPGEPVGAGDEAEAHAAGGAQAGGDQLEPEIAGPPRAPVGDPGNAGYKKRLQELAALAFDQPPPATKQVTEPERGHQPALEDAVSALGEHLASLEDALARTTAACTAVRRVLREGQALLDHPSSSPGAQPSGAQPSGAQPSGAQPSGAQPSGAQPSGAQPSGDETLVVDLRDDEPGFSERAATDRPRSLPAPHRRAPHVPTLSRLTTPLRRYGSVTLRDLLRSE